MPLNISAEYPHPRPTTCNHCTRPTTISKTLLIPLQASGVPNKRVKINEKKYSKPTQQKETKKRSFIFRIAIFACTKCTSTDAQLLCPTVTSSATSTACIWSQNWMVLGPCIKQPANIAVSQYRQSPCLLSKKDLKGIFLLHFINFA